MALASPLLTLRSMDSDRERVEASLLAAVRTRDAYLTELASHLIIAGGKRLRPVMTIAAAQVGGKGSVSDDIIQGAIACELVHLGSLYHDDVMDESTMRRGVDTVNAKWGNLQAIVAGDFLLARASGIAATLGNEIAGLLARTIAALCEGQIEELQHTYSVARTVPSYLVSIEGKTASLFSTSARIGALVAGHESDVVDALTNYGTSFGMVFQIVDDILDVIATDVELGKRAGHDMEEGVYTLPVLLTLAQQSSDSSELRSLLGKPLSKTERERALTIVRAHSGISSAIESANSYVQMAEAECAHMPQGVATDAMRAAPAALLASIIR
ncbi:MAG: polyprenyl synthetase family protein [Actinobacteria bacterium]|nr:MAG: polyprenyl synthetase family protein [Actinomycetota bacterium]